MTKVFVDVGMSLDGQIAGPNRRPGNPLGDGGTTIHQWMFDTRAFWEVLGGSGGTPSADDRIIRAIFARAGAYVMGRRMFDEGEVAWPEEAPFRAPVFVLTHTPREPWVRKGGTTFHFVTDGIDSALKQAKAAAGGKDVRISGGADAIRQYLRAGAVDDVTLHVAPVMMGAGLHLFDGLKPGEVKLEQDSVASSPKATHITYRVVR
jgi:dihydrofolate reductase